MGLITGIPRSGTSLFCALLNRSPTQVALVEPLDTNEFSQAHAAGDAVGFVFNSMQHIRRCILEGRPFPARIPFQGATLSQLQQFDNTFAPAQAGQQHPRKASFQYGMCAVDRRMPADFQLSIKHPNIFMATLPALLEGGFRIAVVIREPVEVLRSWSSLDIPLAQGHAPAAEALDSALKEKLDQEPDVLKRQLGLLSWYFEQLAAVEDHVCVVRHEDLIARPQKVLSSWGLRDVTGLEQHVRKSRPERDQDLAHAIYARLVATDSAALNYYPRPS